MTKPNIAHERLHNQRLAGRPVDNPVDVVRRLCAVQSQDYHGAKWAIAQRSNGATDAELDRAFNDGAILRTHILRPTWHFVMPEDIRWMLKLTAPRVNAVSAYYYRKVELDEAIFRRSNAVISKALRGGKYLTRAQLKQALEAAGIAADGLRLSYLVFRAELDAIVCSGPLRGKQFTYALLEDRAPQVKDMDRDEALAELAKRYFTSHGPALLKDFSWWSGLTMADAKAAVEMVSPRLQNRTVGDKTYWFAEAVAAKPSKAPVIHLLPNYDEHLVAYRDHSASFDPSRISQAEIDNISLLAHIIVLNGHVIGGWKRKIGKNEAMVEIKLSTALDKAEQAALKAAAARYGEFLGKPVKIETL